MRKLCPNYDREDGLETVLEVPIPEEMFAPTGRHVSRSWQNMKSWMRSNAGKSQQSLAALFGAGGRSTEIQLLLGVVGAPLIPLPVNNNSDNAISRNINDHPIESSMARYIVQQYIAASGGDMALDSIDSMYAMGKVRMTACEFSSGDESNHKSKGSKGSKHSGGEMGGFVLWQKRPELWCLELVVSGYKISAGSDGKVAWRQTPWHHSHASRGPPRPLRRFLQGLDPRSTATLFSNSVCIGEKSVNDEDCFILKLDADPSTLKSRSSASVEIIRHTLWGCFSQRTGLLVHLQDSHLLRIKSADHQSILWETTMESLIQDYRTIDGINIAHGGRTCVQLFRHGEGSGPEGTSRTRMEEVWSIEEVDFNIRGLSMDCFLPPADLKKEDEGCGVIAVQAAAAGSLSRLAPFRRSTSTRSNGGSRVAAIDEDDFDGDQEDL